MDFNIPEHIQQRARDARTWVEEVLDPLSADLEKKGNFPTRPLCRAETRSILWSDHPARLRRRRAVHDTLVSIAGGIFQRLCFCSDDGPLHERTHVASNLLFR